MFKILAAAFLVGTVAMVAGLLFLGWQQWRIDRRDDTSVAKPASEPQAEPVLVKAPV